MAGSAGQYVNCFHCGAPYNTMTASWCSCVSAERTLVCPSCLKCFCRAPVLYRQGFWEAASLALLARKRDEHSRPLPTTPGTPVSELRRPLVMVIDDEAGIIRLTVRAIKGIGLGVVWCDDGSKALQMAREYRPEVVLTDVVMPHADGREVCRQIKQDPLLTGTKVIVMSGFYTSDADDRSTRQQNGADDYLPKPIDFVELGAVLRRHTSSH